VWSLRWHFATKSVTGADYSIKSYSLSHSWTLWWRVRWLKHAVSFWGRGGTAAAMTQNEQTTEEHSTLEQQSPKRLDQPAWCVVWTARAAADWLSEWMDIFNGKSTRQSCKSYKAIRPLTLALMQQNVYTGKYRPSNLTHTVVKRQTFTSSIQLT